MLAMDRADFYRKHIKVVPVPVAGCSGLLSHNKRLCICYAEDREWLDKGRRRRLVFWRRCMGLIYDQRPKPPKY